MGGVVAKRVFLASLFVSFLLFSIGASEARAICSSIQAQATQEEEPPEGATPALRGVFQLPDGSPAAGVKLTVQGWEANDSRTYQYGLPENWANPSGTTDAEGRFELFFEPPLAFQFTLDANLSGYATASWRWSWLDPGATKDVGTVTLEPACSVTGFVVNAAGEPSTSGWRVMATSGDPGGEGRDTTAGSSELDPVTGRFQINNLPAGKVRLTAYSRIANWIDGPVVDLRPEHATEANIVYAGPDLSGCITIVSYIWWFWTLDLEPGSVQVYCEGELIGVCKKLEGSSQSYIIDGLEPGEYTVTINDSRFRYWTNEAVKAGESVDAHLVGSGAVRLRVIDAATGLPVKAYGVSVRFQSQDGSFQSEHIFAEGSELPPDRIFYGLIPTDQTVVIFAEGYVTSETWVTELRANATLPVTVALSRGVSLKGKVVGSDGKGVSDAIVAAAPGDVPLNRWDDHHAGWTIPDFSGTIHQVRADDEGNFELSNLTPGKWSIDVRWSNMSLQASAVVSDVDVEGLVYRFLEPGTLKGTVVGPGGDAIEGLTLLVVTSESSKGLRSPMSSKNLVGGPVQTDALGHFETGPLPPGEVRILLVLSDQSIPVTFSSWNTLRSVWIELGRAEVEEGRVAKTRLVARDAFPGNLQVKVRTNELPAAGAVIIATCTSDPGRGPRGTVVDAKGEAAFGALFPGDYKLEAYTLDRKWVFGHPEPVQIRSKKESTAQLEITLVEEQITFIDGETSETLKSEWIGWCRANQSEMRVEGSAQTDLRGQLKLELPLGRYIFRSLERPTSDSEVVEWAKSGAVPATVRLHGE